MTSTGPDQFGERGTALEVITKVPNVSLRDAERSGLALWILTAIFSRDVERPGLRAQEMIARANLAEQLFPSSGSVSA